MLIWSPSGAAIEEKLANGEELKLIIVPFIKLDALTKLLKPQTNLRGLKIVVRWRPQDLLAGVSDLEIYHYLNARGCALFQNSRIHLKLYVFSTNTALCTSANLTMSGLGYRDSANREAGTSVALNSSDWREIYRLLGDSRSVTQDVYECYRDYLDRAPKMPLPELPAFSLPVPKSFSIALLPATRSPREFMDYQLKRIPESASPETTWRVAHDEALFGNPPGLSEAELREWLRERFCTAPFVVAFVQHLKAHGSLRFGAATDWIHRNCDDSPLPYRWELKETTSILYNWLAEFFSPTISWSVPGKHSQVISWRNS